MVYLVHHLPPALPWSRRPLQRAGLTSIVGILFHRGRHLLCWQPFCSRRPAARCETTDPRCRWRFSRTMVNLGSRTRVTVVLRFCCMVAMANFVLTPQATAGVKSAWQYGPAAEHRSAVQ